MNICLVSREYPPDTGWGGIGTYTASLAHGFAERGHRVHVIAQSLDGAREEMDGAVTVHRVCHHPSWLAARRWHEWGLRVEYSALVCKRLKQVIAREAIDVIEAPNFSGEGFVYSWRKQAPLVTRLHTHFSEVIQMCGWQRTFDHSLSCALEDAAILRSDLVTCSTQAHRRVVACAMGMDPARITQIPLGVPLPPEANDHAPIDLPHPAILFVGRLEKRKGIHVLMRAIPLILREVPAAHVFIIGRDTYDTGASSGFTGEARYSVKETVLQEFPQAYLGRVHFLGYVEPHQLESYYRACDIFVAPSLYESFGLIYVEAMAYGKPVVGCSVGGVPEVVDDGVTGILVPPEDPVRLAEAMVSLLRNPVLREELGRNARQAVATRFNRERMVDDTLRAYQRLT